MSIIGENNFQQKINFITAASGILDLISVSDKIECVKLKQESSDEYQITKMSNQTQFILVFWL